MRSTLISDEVEAVVDTSSSSSSESSEKGQVDTDFIVDDTVSLSTHSPDTTTTRTASTRSAAPSRSNGSDFPPIHRPPIRKRTPPPASRILVTASPSTSSARRLTPLPSPRSDSPSMRRHQPPFHGSDSRTIRRSPVPRSPPRRTGTVDSRHPSAPMAALRPTYEPRDDAPRRDLAVPPPSCRVVHYNHPEKGRGKIVVETLFRCAPCDFSCPSATVMHHHLASAEHMTLFWLNRRRLHYKCMFCDLTIPADRKTNWVTHLQGKSHASNVRKAGASL